MTASTSPERIDVTEHLQAALLTQAFVIGKRVVGNSLEFAPFDLSGQQILRMMAAIAHADNAESNGTGDGSYRCR